MARSDKYKIIIMIFAVLIFLGCIIMGTGIASSYNEFLKELKSNSFISATNSEINSISNTFGWSMFFTFLIIGFIFCMFFYLLADILDRLEIISAQTTRTTRVLEDNEDKEKNNEDKED